MTTKPMKDELSHTGKGDTVILEPREVTVQDDGSVVLDLGRTSHPHTTILTKGLVVAIISKLDPFYTQEVIRNAFPNLTEKA